MDQFIAQLNNKHWKHVHDTYAAALKLKASKMKLEKKKELLKLDLWYQSELPTAIQSRKPRHITYEEICKLMKWKLTRGKFRPRLTELVQANSPKDVVEASTAAFAALPNVTNAIKALVVLKAIGPATASAVLAAGAPKHAAFMADESMHALPGLLPIKYDLPFYLDYMKQVIKITKELNKEDPDKSWTAHTVELTLWTYQVVKTLDADLFKSLNDVESDGPPSKKKKR